MPARRLPLLILLTLCLDGAAAPGEKPGPVKVFVLAGQSNMEGQAVVDLEGPDYNGGRGTLVDRLRDPGFAAEFPQLRNPGGDWRTREDVWVRFATEAGPVLHGPLGMGFTGYCDSHHFGPELGIGRVLGDRFSNQVLLVKAAWGGRSLYQDFRPPSSGNPGPFYSNLVAQVRQALRSLGTDFPGAQGAQAELAGLVWYQGWNDGVDPEHAIPQYETNLVNLIHDLRREFAAPGLPVVIGELTGPWVDAPAEWTALRRAQSAAAGRPEFAGNVAFVPTRSFVRPPEASPNPTHGHHEFGNAETCLRVGEALGQAMATLALPRPQGYQTRRIAGWTAQFSEHLLLEQAAAVDAMLPLLDRQLDEIARGVPAPAVARLREVTLWFSPEYPGLPGHAEYHPDAGWLRSHGRNPAMARGVEVTNVRRFAEETDRMPNFILHELAHAYHDRVLSFEQPEILAAWRAAKASGNYARVERYNGRGRANTFETAYAMTDHKEYFAELTEAYFSRNDFFPFTRDELAAHDPKMHALLERLWNPGPTP
jgi:hypothetical protein